MTRTFAGRGGATQKPVLLEGKAHDAGRLSCPLVSPHTPEGVSGEIGLVRGRIVIFHFVFVGGGHFPLFVVRQTRATETRRSLGQRAGTRNPDQHVAFIFLEPPHREVSAVQHTEMQRKRFSGALGIFGSSVALTVRPSWSLTHSLPVVHVPGGHATRLGPPLSGSSAFQVLEQLFVSAGLLVFKQLLLACLYVSLSASFVRALSWVRRLLLRHSLFRIISPLPL